MRYSDQEDEAVFIPSDAQVIAQLQEQNQKYRDALKKIVKSDTGEFGMAGSLYLCRDCQNKEDIAHEALKEKV
jgi:hypothetical protein